MQLTSVTYSKSVHEKVATKILHFSLLNLLPEDRKLALNLESRTLSLLTAGPLLVVEQQFSVNEMRMIFPILEAFPHYCPYEVLLASLSNNVVTPASIEYCQERLLEAQVQGTWQQELRPVRRAITSLRTKLWNFNLGVSNIRERGCSLTGLASAMTPQSGKHI